MTSDMIKAAASAFLCGAAALQGAVLPEKGADGSLRADFSKGAAQSFYCSDGWTNGNVFNVTWRAENIRFEDGVMKLFIDRDRNAAGDVPYSGAEYASDSFYGYGRYEVVMKAIRNDGVVSSFFTFTGAPNSDPWDEIDIEFLGSDTTKVQFNYFSDGRSGYEYIYDLGFDAAEDFHTYAFEWTPDSITWYADGKKAHTAVTDIPKTPGRIMANTWCGKGVDGWCGRFDDTSLPLHAEYRRISYTPMTSVTDI